MPFFAGRRFPCRGAVTDSHGLPARKTMKTLQLQYFSWWSMPLLCRSCLTCLLSRPSSSTTGALGPDSARHCLEVPQMQGPSGGFWIAFRVVRLILTVCRLGVHAASLIVSTASLRTFHTARRNVKVKVNLLSLFGLLGYGFTFTCYVSSWASSCGQLHVLQQRS